MNLKALLRVVKALSRAFKALLRVNLYLIGDALVGHSFFLVLKLSNDSTALLSFLNWNTNTKKKLSQTRGSPIKLRLYQDLFKAALR